MKQLAFMFGMLFLGSAGALAYGYFWSIFVYYTFVVLRPPFLWPWSPLPGYAWQTYAAAPAILYATLALGETARPGRNFSWVQFWLFAFFCWITIGLSGAQNQELAWSWYNINFKIFLMAFAGSVLIANVAHVRWLIWMTAGCLGYIGYEMNYQYFVNGFMFIRVRGFGEYDNNTAGLMHAMGIPLCWFIWESMQSRWRWLFAAFIPLLLHAVLMSFSRGAMLSLLVVTPLIVFRSRFRIYTLIGVVIFAVVGLPFFAGQEIRDRFTSIETSDQDASAQSRWSTWTAAYRMTLDHPIFGVGMRNSNALVGRYGNKNSFQTIHSQYLQVAADTGFVGLGFYLAAIVAALLAASKARRAADRLPEEHAISIRAMANGLECCLVTFLVGAVFLSLETFEPTYLILILMARLGTLTQAATSVPDAA